MAIVELDDGMYEKTVAGRVWRFTAPGYDTALKMPENNLRNAVVAAQPKLFRDFKFTQRFKEAELAAVLAATDSRPEPAGLADPHTLLGVSKPAKQTAPSPAPVVAGHIGRKTNVDDEIILSSLTRDEVLCAMSGPELRELCRSYGLKTSYTKPQLLLMIIKHEEGR